MYLCVFRDRNNGVYKFYAIKYLPAYVTTKYCMKNILGCRVQVCEEKYITFILIPNNKSDFDLVIYQ